MKVRWVLDPETGTFSKEPFGGATEDGTPFSRLPEYRKRYHQQKYRDNPAYRTHVKDRERARQRLYRVGSLPNVEETLCEICGGDNGKRAIHLDHDHKTGEFRGWLCSNCNTGIGMFADDPDRLEEAARYLRAVRT